MYSLNIKSGGDRFTLLRVLSVRVVFCYYFEFENNFDHLPIFAHPTFYQGRPPQNKHFTTPLILYDQ